MTTLPSIDALAQTLSALTPVNKLRHLPATNSLTFDCNAGKLRISSWTADILRIQLGEPAGPDYGLITGTAAPQVVSVSTAGNVVSATAGAFQLAGDTANGTLTVTRGGKLLFAPPSDAHFTRQHRYPQFANNSEGHCVLTLDLDDNECIHGLGEKWSGLDLRGQLIHSYNHDSLGGNAERSYKNIPFLWSSLGWGLVFNTPGPITHAIGYAPLAHRSYTAYVEEGLDVFLLHANSPQAMLHRFHDLCGKPGRVPAWSFGAWLSKAYFNDEQELLDAAKQVRAHDLPIDVIVLDGRTWLDTDTRFAFEWDHHRYFDPQKTLQTLHQLNFKVCAWVYPLCSIANKQYPQLCKQNVFLRQRNGEPLVYKFAPEPFDQVLTPLPDSGIVDFTSDSGCAWWQAGCRKLLNQGINAFKTDFGEQVPDYALASNGDSGRRLHNVYALLYNRTTFAAFDGTDKEPMLWARAGWLGSHRYPTHWVGDTQSDWGGMRTAVRGQLAWMLSGGAYSSSDIGGFFGEQPHAELYKLWLQHGTFSAHMRIHGIGPREPWSFGKKTLTHCQRWLQQRAALRPYLVRTAEQAATKGVPMMRPLMLAYTDSVPKDRACELQYMLGDDILCVAHADEKDTRFWLPPGRWYCIVTNKFLDGDVWQVDKRGQPKRIAFLRVGSIIELADVASDGTATTLQLVGEPAIGNHACGVSVVRKKSKLVLINRMRLHLTGINVEAVRLHGNQWLIRTLFKEQLTN